MVIDLVKKLLSSPHKERSIHEYVPGSLQNLSPVQERNYRTFVKTLQGFYIGKNIEEGASSDRLEIGIDDGYLGSIEVGEILPDGSINLKYPKPEAADSGRLRELLGGTLRLKKTLEQNDMKYGQNITSEEDYFRQIEEVTRAKVDEKIAEVKRQASSKLETILDLLTS